MQRRVSFDTGLRAELVSFVNDKYSWVELERLAEGPTVKGDEVKETPAKTLLKRVASDDPVLRDRIKVCFFGASDACVHEYLGDLISVMVFDQKKSIAGNATLGSLVGSDEQSAQPIHTMSLAAMFS